MTDFIDVHKKDKYYQNKINKIKDDTELSERNKDIILKYLNDSELGKTIKKGQRKKIGAGRNLQTAGFLNKMAKDWFKKDLDKVTIENMETFIHNLEKGKILSRYNKPYSSEQKSNIKKFIRKFYKHILTEGKYYPDLVDWIDTSFKETLVEAVPKLKEGVWEIVELIPDIRRKALVWVAWDSGFREGELINCRLKDIEKTEDGIYYITCRHSKTKPRTVSLPYSSELLDRWLKEFDGKREDQLWNTSRVMFYKTVKLYGKKAHNQNITVHMLRHTSASFWASRLDRASFCKRFGWSYSSNTPDRYIDFAKVTEKKVVDIAKAEQYGDLKRKSEQQEADLIALKEAMERKDKEMAKRMLEMDKKMIQMWKKKK